MLESNGGVSEFYIEMFITEVKSLLTCYIICYINLSCMLLTKKKKNVSLRAVYSKEFPIDICVTSIYWGPGIAGWGSNFIFVQYWASAKFETRTVVPQNLRNSTVNWIFIFKFTEILE